MPEIDHDILYKLEEGLDPVKPQKSEIPIKVLGYGEISSILPFLTYGILHLSVCLYSVQNPQLKRTSGSIAIAVNT